MREYYKPIIEINDISVNEDISAVYNGDEAEGSLISTNYTGPENSAW